MRTIVILFGALLSLPLASAGPVLERLVLVPDPARPGEWLAVPDPDEGPDPRNSTVAFDNRTQPANGGRTLFEGVMNVGSSLMGEDIIAVPRTGGYVSFAEIAVRNQSTTEWLTRVRYTFAFYGSDGTPLGSLIFSVTIHNPIPPGGAFFFGTEMRFANIIVPDDFMFAFRIDQTENFNNDMIGLWFGGPVTAGSSSRFTRNLTTGEVIDMGSPDRNLIYYIETQPIPAPGALPLLLAAAATRRRVRMEPATAAPVRAW